AADPVRRAEQRAAPGRLRDRNPEAVLADPQARPGCAAGRARQHRRIAAPAGGNRVLVVPDHGRAGAGDAGAGRLEPAGAAAAAAARVAGAAPRSAADGAGGIRGGDRRLGHHRGRAPAVHGLQPDDHGRERLAAGGPGGGRLAGRVRAGVLHRVRLRHLVHPAADGQGRAGAGIGARRRRGPDPYRRHRARPGRTDRRPGSGAMSVDIVTVWAGLILFAVFAYVVMDGFDLGIGILFPAFAPGHGRNQAINSVAPVWDGNETWLVFGGGGLLAAFPLAYGVIMTALYPPVIAMLLALVFRGVAFEARWRDPAHRPWWDLAFNVGSTVAAFSQGVILGALLQGIAVEDRVYAGGWLDWLTPFSLLTGASVVVGYALLGATWLVWKTEGDTQAQARRFAPVLGLGLLAGIVAVSLATLGLE